VKKLVLNCGLSPGDIVMLTAAVRDLHRCHPGSYVTDVRTRCQEIWDHNPHLTTIADGDSEAQLLDCRYPLINRANLQPYHCLHGFIEFLNEKLGLAIRPTEFKGDIHLSAQERAWYSQVHEVTREDTPFWIVDAGGKYDVTIKWWQAERYQAVVDHFRGRIQFVQVGSEGHHHPRLEGVIDLRGKTNLRELIRLVYHAQGVLCPVTALMHLAAAVPIKADRPAPRACVVIAGGREPAHWEAYPSHQFIHTIGALPCCATGGCWRDRTFRLRDGDHRDSQANRCTDVAGELPRCMSLITPEEVARRIELFFEGSRLKFLNERQAKAASAGVRRTRRNDYDGQKLTLAGAGMACDRHRANLGDYPGGFEGRGIVICAGGPRYFTNAWVCIRMLRRHQCKLPIQVWHRGQCEMDERMKALLTPLGVECVDAFQVARKFPARRLGGWELKPYALVHCPFKEVLLLDADNVPVANPEYLFDTLEFRQTGATFWPDYTCGDPKKTRAIWRSCGLRQPDEPEFESGQIVVDKARCWKALLMSHWFNQQSDFYYQYLHGDKETFHLGFRKVGKPYSLVPKPLHRLEGTMCQHDFAGRRIFQHRNTAKWDFLPHNRMVRGFRFESECREDLAELRRHWSGRVGPAENGASQPRVPNRRLARPVRIAAVMISCAERDDVRRGTLERLSRTDWGDAPLSVHMDDAKDKELMVNQARCSLRALRAGLESPADYVLFLEDDLDFNRHLMHNLEHWPPVRERRFSLASLYNPQLGEAGYHLAGNARLMAPDSVYGSQAFLLSKPALRNVIRRWNQVKGFGDLRIARLAGDRGEPIFYHAPSLVQHVGRKSVWGGHFHQAADFDPEWKA
jgi:ADP-heptose:LPS heptosyltransferase